jgi:hypothetical protein
LPRWTRSSIESLGFLGVLDTDSKVARWID